MFDTILDVALAYHARGWSVFPVYGKRPAIPEWKPYQTQLPTEAEVRRWWQDHPSAGIGCALGKLSGLVRIDAEGRVPWSDFPLTPTLQFVTPSGRGWLYQYLEGVITEVAWKGDGHHEELRIQSDGSYCVLPPTARPDGGVYLWEDESAQPARVPDWVRLRAVERMIHALDCERRPLQYPPDKADVEGALACIPADDYDKWIDVGMALKSSGYELAIWDEWSQTSGKYVGGECERKWETFADYRPGGLTAASILYWAEQHGWQRPRRFPPINDSGNATLLVKHHRDDFKHSDKWGWLAWDGARWTEEGATKKVLHAVEVLLERRKAEAIRSLSKHLGANTGDDRKTKSKVGTVKQIGRHQYDDRIKGAANVASRRPDFTVNYREFDKHPFLLNCSNGTLDLRTRELRPHDPKDMLTQLCPTEYSESAECPRWEQFLQDILPDSDVRSFVKQFLGCCLTGDVSPQIMPVFWGTGANGKSTLIEVVRCVLGEDYSMKAKRDLLMASWGNSHPTSIARLRGKRFVACVETAEDGRLDEALVKELTGSDTIAARRMREDEWEFEPTHKPILATNHRPEVRGTDEAIWRRIALVPFTVKFLNDDPRRIPDLKEKLKQEAEGVLRWMAEGCAEWLAADRKLPLPQAVKDTTKEHRGECDKLAVFLAECCVTGPDCEVCTEKLMERYAMWCEANKHTTLNGTKFGRALSERGYKLAREKYRGGLKLKEGD